MSVCARELKFEVERYPKIYQLQKNPRIFLFFLGCFK